MACQTYRPVSSVALIAVALTLTRVATALPQATSSDSSETESGEEDSPGFQFSSPEGIVMMVLCVGKLTLVYRSDIESVLTSQL